MSLAHIRSAIAGFVSIAGFVFLPFTFLRQTKDPIYKKIYYARKQNASRVFAIIWASVRLSVRLSVCHTRELYQNVARSLIYRDKISCHWVQGFPSNEGVKEGYPLKDVTLPLLARIM